MQYVLFGAFMATTWVAPDGPVAFLEQKLDVGRIKADVVGALQADQFDVGKSHADKCIELEIGLHLLGGEHLSTSRTLAVLVHDSRQAFAAERMTAGQNLAVVHEIVHAHYTSHRLEHFRFILNKRNVSQRQLRRHLSNVCLLCSAVLAPDSDPMYK